MRKIIIVLGIVLLSLPAIAQKSGKPDLKKLSKEDTKELETTEYFYSNENYLRAVS